MTKKLLTIIIPFINEKYEVENTIKSIRSHSDNKIDIILINDDSNDGFDYGKVAKKYNTIYIVNKKRLGVAASRDYGVDLCQTPYFLLLDAHMRFYDNLWQQKIISELETDERILLCCQTKSLGMENGLLVEHKHRATSFGSCINFYDGKHFLEPIWIKSEISRTNDSLIPCVLGAGYACSKKYWQYLKGLEGLIYYGNDEPYISMKVWMEGGKCKLMEDVTIGHIYRNNQPYFVDNISRLYNRLFIAKLLLPENIIKKRFSEIQYYYNRKQISEVLYMLQDNKDKIVYLKNYYQKIFNRDFSFYKNLNEQMDIFNNIIENTDDVLNNIALRIKNQSIQDIGILKGRMGNIIFLYHYAQYSMKEEYGKLADCMLKNLFQNIRADISICFYSGLAGIGWGIEYLYQNGFVEGNTNEILEEFDCKIMEINPLRVFELNRNYGLGGLLLYLLARLYTIEREKKKCPFDAEYLEKMYQRLSTIVAHRTTDTDSLDIFLKFMKYYEEKEIEKPSIYDITCLLNVSNIPICEFEIGLQGCTGVGLKLIMEKEL